MFGGSECLRYTRLEFSDMGNSVADFRLYVHSTGQKIGPLTATEILSVSQDAPAGVEEQYTCASAVEKMSDLMDRSWRDDKGHNCNWYSGAKKIQPIVCDSKRAADNCPLSCGTKQKCFESQEESKTVYFAWDRLRRLEPSYANGSICVGTDQQLNTTTSKSKVIRDCKKWLVNGGLKSRAQFGKEFDLRLWRNRVDVDKLNTGPFVNITDCNQLEAATDESCAFDKDPVKAFTRTWERRTAMDFRLDFGSGPLELNH